MQPTSKILISWTTREFPKDFNLKLEFRAAVNADSGIFIRGRNYNVAIIP